MTARPKAREQAPSGVVLLLRLALALVSLGVLGIFGWMVAHRLPYPYDLEWMESGMLCHALRLLNGQPIYAPPSVDFIPHLYTPLWSMVVVAGPKEPECVACATCRTRPVPSMRTNEVYSLGAG